MALHELGKVCLLVVGHLQKVRWSPAPPTTRTNNATAASSHSPMLPGHRLDFSSQTQFAPNLQCMEPLKKKIL